MKTKSEIRSELKKRRGVISLIEMAELSARIAEGVLSLPEYAQAKTVLCYANLRDEVLTSALIREIIRSGRTLALPAVRGEEMKALRLTSPELMHRGAFRILEPDGDEEIAPEEFDLLLVPGVGFDPQGNRLGYGGGYFDRFLSASRGVKVGLCYSVQVMDEIPAEPHDISMDIIVTEKEIYRCKETL